MRLASLAAWEFLHLVGYTILMDRHLNVTGLHVQAAERTSLAPRFWCDLRLLPLLSKVKLLSRV